MVGVFSELTLKTKESASVGESDDDESAACGDTDKPRSDSPIPQSASKWKSGHAEMLGIYYVPLERSKYLQQVQKRDQSSSSCRHGYEYDYKGLLKDVIKPDNSAWWDNFETALEQYNIMKIVERNLTLPNIGRDQSVLLSDALNANQKSRVRSAGKSRHMLL